MVLRTNGIPSAYTVCVDERRGELNTYMNLSFKIYFIVTGCFKDSVCTLT